MKAPRESTINNVHERIYTEFSKKNIIDNDRKILREQITKSRNYTTRV